MNIKTLKLTNFRNIRNVELKLIDGTNIIYGANAQGKTNILESIFMFCSGRSHRAGSDAELICDGQDFLVIKVEFSDGIREFSGVLELGAGKKKQISINGVKIRKLSQIANYINVVMFAPEDLAIVKEGPAVRRRFMDMVISQINPAYVSYLTDYYKALIQRNNLLKQKHLQASDDVMSVWEEKIAQLASRIIVYRRDYMGLLFKYASHIHTDITGERLRCRYIADSVGDLDGSEAAEDIQERLLYKIKENSRRDLEIGTTSVGVHRDDCKFLINLYDARRFGSQGQQRSVVLSLKLAQTELVKQIKNSYPIILLDDIMSELDQTRRCYLAGRINNKQVIITCTDKQAAYIGGRVKYFYVQNGSVREDG